MARASVCVLLKKTDRRNEHCPDPRLAFELTAGSCGLTPGCRAYQTLTRSWVRLWVQLQMREILQRYQCMAPDCTPPITWLSVRWQEILWV